jgi:hypothetical protein
MFAIRTPEISASPRLLITEWASFRGDPAAVPKKTVMRLSSGLLALATVTAAVLAAAGLAAAGPAAAGPAAAGPAAGLAAGWSVKPSPNRGTAQNRLQGISCLSATACTAAGYYLNSGPGFPQTLIESSDGAAEPAAPRPDAPTAG